jgi:hypothetical protein
MGRVEIVIQSRRINGVEGQLPDHPMVGVENILNIKSTIGRVVSEDPVGANLPDDPYKVPPEFQGVLKLPVGFPEKNDVLGANDPSGGPLFLLPQGRQGMTGKSGVVGPFFPAGADAVEDFGTLAGPPGHGSPAAEVHIIRMGADDQNPLAFFIFDLPLFQSLPLTASLKSQLQIPNKFEFLISLW